MVRNPMTAHQRILVHISKDLHEPLEIERLNRCDRTVAETARALLRETLTRKGLLKIENRWEEKPG